MRSHEINNAVRRSGFFSHTCSFGVFLVEANTRPNCFLDTCTVQSVFVDPVTQK